MWVFISVARLLFGFRAQTKFLFSSFIFSPNIFWRFWFCLLVLFCSGWSLIKYCTIQFNGFPLSHSSLMQQIFVCFANSTQSIDRWLYPFPFSYQPPWRISFSQLGVVFILFAVLFIPRISSQVLGRCCEQQ